MVKIATFTILFLVYAAYSVVVYTKGTATKLNSAQKEIAQGKALFQQYNCIACHQLYGLGGFLGPELTTAYSDPKRGEAYMRVFLSNGGPRMPAYHFSPAQVDALISYFKSVDESAVTYK